PTPRSAILAAASPSVASASMERRLCVMWSATSGMRRFYDPSVEGAAQPRATGRCLCGAVRYAVRGPRRHVVLCQCEECARWGGYVGAFAATRDDDLELVAQETLVWVDSPASDRHAQRGFCGACGSSLFWRAADGERVSIAAGTLDRPTGLPLAGHWDTRQSSDYEERAGYRRTRSPISIPFAGPDYEGA